MKFRELRADEIEARVATVSDKGCSILLYKNARCDMNILDETVGETNWQRDHKEVKGNMYAGIGIWDEDKKMWIWKWDCGTESYAEAKKGEASDSFKRAGFNWGIGRELYTAPFIWMKKSQINLLGRNGKMTTYDKFAIEEIKCVDGKISKLKVVDNETGAAFIYDNGKTVYKERTKKETQKEDPNAPISEKEAIILDFLIEEANVNKERLLSNYKVEHLELLKMSQYTSLKEKLKGALSNACVNKN